jgi:hypothetical protein
MSKDQACLRFTALRGAQSRRNLYGEMSWIRYIPDLLASKEPLMTTACDTLETVTSHPIKTSQLVYLVVRVAEIIFGTARRHHAERLQL